MASSMSLWEVDPFFPAAEEVQNSSDRMESIFRSWKFYQGLAVSSPQDSSTVYWVDINKRDLVTAVDTVRWQLEEFARAVEVANLGEDSKARHSQFVRAIQSQVCNIESELGDALQNRSYRNLEEADSRCLEHFLSGGCDLEETTQEEQPQVSSCPSVSIRIDIDEECNGHQTNGLQHHQNGGGRVEPSKGWKVWRRLKRWKDGETSLLSRAEECISSLRNGFMANVEQGRNGRKVNGSSSSYSPPGERRMQRGHQLIPVGNTVITVAAIFFVGLMGLYFWFLTTLVPYDDQPVPGSFLH